MAGIIPDSTFYLLKDIDLDSDYEYTMDFNSLEEQKKYFDEHIASELPKGEYSYIRTNDTINIFAPIESIIGLNYCMFTNNDKTYYAFIMAKEYVSESVTRLRLKIDAFQTFMFDYELKESFVSREHQDRWYLVSSSDGDHIYPTYSLTSEDLDIGTDYDVETITNVSWHTTSERKLANFLIIAKESLDEKSVGDPSIIGGFNTGVYVYFNTFAPFDIDNPNILAVRHIPFDPYFIKHKQEKDEIIECSNGYLFLKNIDCVRSTTYEDVQPDGIVPNNYSIPLNAHLMTLMSINDRASKVREPKLDTYPFRFIKLYCNGKASDVKIEHIGHLAFTDYKNLHAGLRLTFMLSSLVNGGMIIGIDGYLRKGDFENGVNGQAIDMTLRTDAWQNYLLNNKASLNGGLAVAGTQFVLSSLLGGISSALKGGATGEFLGSSAISFGGQIANEMLRREDIKNQPDEVRAGAENYDILNYAGKLCSIQIWNIQAKFEDKIYKYFMHYGYKTNEFKKPDTRSRYYYNYIKTIGVNIKAGFDKQWQDEIKAIYNRGTTIWHYRDKETFKGINNYDFENVEMALLGS